MCSPVLLPFFVGIVDLNPFCSFPLFYLNAPLAPALSFPSPHSVLGECHGINFHPHESVSLTPTITHIPGLHLLLLVFTFIHGIQYKATCCKLTTFLSNLPASFLLHPLTTAPLPSQQPGLESHQLRSSLLLPVIICQWLCDVTLTSAGTWCARRIKKQGSGTRG